METVGKKIKFYREQKGMSLRELGKLANVSHSFISDIEHERSTPSLATLEAIANALNIPTSLLISDNEKTEPSPEQQSPRRRIRRPRTFGLLAGIIRARRPANAFQADKRPFP